MEILDFVYLQPSLSRTIFSVPCEFEIERVHRITKPLAKFLSKLITKIIFFLFSPKIGRLIIFYLFPPKIGRLIGHLRYAINVRECGIS